MSNKQRAFKPKPQPGLYPVLVQTKFIDAPTAIKVKIDLSPLSDVCSAVAKMIHEDLLEQQVQPPMDIDGNVLSQAHAFIAEEFGACADNEIASFKPEEVIVPAPIQELYEPIGITKVCGVTFEPADPLVQSVTYRVASLACNYQDYDQPLEMHSCTSESQSYIYPSALDKLQEIKDPGFAFDYKEYTPFSKFREMRKKEVRASLKKSESSSDLRKQKFIESGILVKWIINNNHFGFMKPSDQTLMATRIRESASMQINNPYDRVFSSLGSNYFCRIIGLLPSNVVDQEVRKIVRLNNQAFTNWSRNLKMVRKKKFALEGAPPAFVCVDQSILTQFELSEKDLLLAFLGGYRTTYPGQWINYQLPGVKEEIMKEFLRKSFIPENPSKDNSSESD